MSALWFAAVPVQFVIWALVSVLGFHWTEPWWLWTLVSGPFLIGPLWGGSPRPTTAPNGRWPMARTP